MLQFSLKQTGIHITFLENFNPTILFNQVTLIIIIVLSAFLPPVGCRSFRSHKIDLFLYSKQLCFEIISLKTNSRIL